MAYTHVDLFPLGEDKTPYRALGSEGVSVEKLGDREVGATHQDDHAGNA